MPSFNFNHPECMPDEFFVGNATEASYEMYKWKTKRRGNQAYNVSGVPIKNAFPVFFQKWEWEAQYPDTPFYTD